MTVDVDIEYCSSCGYHAKADDLRKAINDAYGDNVDVSIHSGRPGSFEITICNGTLIYSKLNTKKWPKFSDIVSEVGQFTSGIDEKTSTVVQDMRKSEQQKEADDANADTMAIEAFVKKTIEEHPIVLFSSTDCLYCKNAKQLLNDDIGVSSLHIVEVNHYPHTFALRSVLASVTGKNTVPCIFIAGKYIGGFDEAAVHHNTGELTAMLDAADVSYTFQRNSEHLFINVDVGKGTSEGITSEGIELLDLSKGIPKAPNAITNYGRTYVGEEARRARSSVVPTAVIKVPQWLRWPLFWFPYNVDQNHSRCISTTMSILCIVAAAGYKNDWSAYMCAVIFTDYVCRFLFGGKASIVGALTYSIAYYLPPRQYPGPPKQFAQMVGCMFSGTATVLLWVRSGNEDTNGIVACVVLACLAGAAALDGVVGFCLGCFMFNGLSKIGFYKVDPSARCDTIAEEFTTTQLWQKQRVAESNPTLVIKNAPNNNKALPYIYKIKNDDQKKEDFQLVKHFGLLYFTWPIGVAGLAAIFSMLSANPNTAVSESYWHVLIIISLVVLGFCVLLFVAKFTLFPEKMLKEFDHPLKSNCIAALPICLGLYCMILYDYWKDKSFIMTIFWMAGLSMLFITCERIMSWIRNLHYKAWMLPSWMMAPVGNLIIAAAAPLISKDYDEIAYIWFSTGILFWLVLFTLQFQRITFGSYVAPDVRNGFFSWVAAPAIAAVAWSSIVTLTKPDPVFLFLFFFSLLLMIAMLFLTLSSYFGRDKFSIAYFGILFPLEAFSIAAIKYNMLHHSSWSHFLAIASASAATYFAVVLHCHMLSGFITRTSIFIPEIKSGPGNLGKMMHYAFRFSLEKMIKLSKRVHRAAELKELAETWAEYSYVHEIHAHFEDTIVFKAFDEVFPGLSTEASHQHEVGHGMINDLTKILDRLVPNAKRNLFKRARKSLLDAPPDHEQEAPTETDLTQIHDLIERIAEFDNNHFDYEEQHLQAIGRKYFNLKVVKGLWKKVWEDVEITDWRIVMPFVIANQEIHARRNMFLSGWLAVIPEKMHLIGQMLWENIDELLWDRIIVDTPSLVPRNVDHHTHYY